MNPHHSLQLPKNLLHDFLTLSCRYAMTPTCISSLLMYVILPAKILHKDNAILLDKGLHEEECVIQQMQVRKVKNNSDKYTVYFGGNGQDCLDEKMVTSNKIENHYIYWNYPGVKNNLASHSPEELYKAGYIVVNQLINQSISPQNIELFGWSLGGNIASEVARRLYRENKFVNLRVLMSFSTISWVIPELLKEKFLKSKDKNQLGIYLSSIFSMSSLILMLAGFPGSIINTITLILMNTLAFLSYCIAFVIQSPGMLLQESMNKIGFEKLGIFLAMPWMELGKLFNQMMNFLAQSIYNITWWIVGIASVLILIPMLLAGLVIGLLVGAFLSLQLLWTDSPCVLPMHTLCDLALKINSCNMDSVDAIQEMLEHKSGDINIINTDGDNVIYPNASLCTGMRFPLKDKQKSLISDPQCEMRFPLEDEQERLISDPQCEWYEGGHNWIGIKLRK